MPSYLTELYLGRHRHRELTSLRTRARDAARTLIDAGQPVAYLRCAFVPEDEVCLLWFIAPSRAVLSELEHLAKLEFDRVIEELEPPQTREELCQPESA
jgi:hypothetical protein